jgi:LacI family transcriptional regulator
LIPELLENLRPIHTLWIDEMRALLIEQDCKLRVFHRHLYFRAKAGGSLQRLVRQNPSLCWILVLADEATQRWFAENHVPCVVAGSAFAGLDLPSVDLDHRMLCRHAAGVLLGLGHRRIALLNHKSRRAGDVESELGFIEGLRNSPHADVKPLIVYYGPTVSHLSHLVSRMMH